MFSLAIPLQPPPLPSSTCLASLLKMFWAIQYSSWVVLYAYSEKICKTPKKQNKNVMKFFGKVGLQHPNLLKWNLTMRFPGITETIFWWIVQNSCYMESLQISDKFCSGCLAIFLNMAYIFMQYIGDAKQSFAEVFQNRFS